MQLTPEQDAIIHADFDEHCVITAVAGSGKTTTLAWRIRHLLAQGHDPRRVLILMFNKQAQLDFVKKLRQVIPEADTKLPEVRTYHAMGYRLYQRFIQEGLLPPMNMTPLAEHEIEWQIWRTITQLAPAELQDEIKRNKKDHVEAAVKFVDLCKTTLQTPEEVFEALEYAAKYRYFLEVFTAFEEWRQQAQRITFADMLYVPVKLIHHHAQARQLVENKMDFLLVDEYQDTNEIQHLLLRYVAGKRARVTVVGDPDQTIYEFRGARPEYILNRFAEEFESPREQTLSCSFRYGHRVALLANHLISHNKGRKDVLCHSHRSTPDTGVHWHQSSAEVEQVVAIIEQHLQHQGKLADIVILLRVWSQSVAIELILLEKGMAYLMDNGRSALASKEVEALIGVLALASGELSLATPEVRHRAFERLLRFPHIGLKDSLMQPLCNVLAQRNSGYGEILENWIDKDLIQIQRMKLQRTGRLWTSLLNGSSAASRVSDLLRAYIEQTELYAGLRALALTHEAAEEQIGRVEGFLRYIESVQKPLPELLVHLRILREQALKPRTELSGRGAPLRDALLISSIHRTKGLEWPVVIIPGLSDKLLPYTLTSGRSGITAEYIESERRLLYVAMTRAIKGLHLISPAVATDGMGEVHPSRFLTEINCGLCDELGAALYPATSGTLQLSHPLTGIARRYAALLEVSLSSSQAVSAQAGPTGGAVWACTEVVHAIFGKGKVIAEAERSFTVQFEKNQTMEFSKQSAHLYFSQVN
ncbi:MAG: ATP-dependent helicase [Hahellaceae bacterium]|nr:ATP-dependent helicase [Hahellaceae bacterium]MCP5169199.1 ATP-dependent helicase [Hahellaceae bacterium]